MEAISSRLTGNEIGFEDMMHICEQQGFVLGGNWEYDKGCLDKNLDNENKVWLRIPFVVLNGELSSEAGRSNAHIQLLEPFVLNHIYNEGNDLSGDVGVISASFNQFQAPLNPDASVSHHWHNKGKQIIHQLEGALAPLLYTK